MSVASGVESGDASTAVLGQLSPALDNIIGNIQTAIGRATISRAGGNHFQARFGDPVRPGDVIETAADGQIEIRFIDGTVFNLSHDAGVVLGDFTRDTNGSLRSALLTVTRGAFAFAAGQLVKAGPLIVDTAVGSIRSRSQASGFGLLSLAALIFSFAREAHAADPDVTFLDDDSVTYKDLHHGVFELVTKEATPRHIIVEDPGETVVLNRTGSSVGVSTVANTPAQMQELQTAQQDVLANYAKGWADSGSGTSPFPNARELLQPINFIQPDPTEPQNQLPVLETAVFTIQQVFFPIQPTLAITSIGGQISVGGDNLINASKANAGVEIAGATSGVEDGEIVTVAIIDASDRVVYSGTAAVSNGAWLINLGPANAKALADGVYTLTATVSNAGGQVAEASQAIRVDETPPTIAIDLIARSNVVNAAAANNGFVVAGTTTDAENGQPVTVKIVDSSGQVVDIFVTTLTNNGWSVNVTSAEAKLLHDGSYTVIADVSDAAGNPAPEAAQTLTVDRTPPTVTWLPPAERGIEGMAITLGTIAATANGQPGHSNSVQSLLLSGIPVGAVLTDGANSFVATSGDTSIDVKGWNLASLKITPPNDVNFTLTVTATDQDANTASASELVTVSPLAPALNPVAAQGNENAAIALDLGATARSLSGANGDASPNSLAALVVSDIPVGATLSDGTGGHSFTATAGHTSQDVAGWNLSSLTITPPTEFEGSFTLKIAASERDSEGDVSATVTATECVTVNPVAEPPTACAPPTLTLDEDAICVAVAGLKVGPLAEDADDTVSATLTVSHGTLHVAGLSGVTVTGDDSGTLKLSGSAAAVNTLLAGLTYTPTADYEGCDTLRLSVTSSDGSNTYPAAATASTAITVNPVAEPPTACAPPTLTLDENAICVTVAGLKVGPLAQDADDTVSATLTVSHGMLHVAGLSGVTVTGDDSATLTLSGSAAAVNSLLAGLTYTPTTEYEGCDTLRLSVTSSDGSDTYPAAATASTAITVNPVAEPPTACAPQTASTCENKAVEICGVVVGPPAEDADDTVKVSLSVAHGTLAVCPVGGVTEIVSAPGCVTLSGAAADVNAVLASLIYTPDACFTGCDRLEVSVTSIDGSNTYPTPATAETAISVGLHSEALIVDGPEPSIHSDVSPTSIVGATVSAPAVVDATAQPGSSFVFDQAPAFEGANAMTINHGAAPLDVAQGSSNELAPSETNSKDNSEAGTKSQGSAPVKDADATNDGSGHPHGSGSDPDAVSDNEALKAPTNGTHSSAVHEVHAHDVGSSSPGQAKSEGGAGTPGQAFHFKDGMSEADAAGINDTANSNDHPPKSHHDDAAMTQASQAAPGGGETFAWSGDTFHFKGGEPNPKSWVAADVAELSLKGSNVPPGSGGAQVVGLSAHEQHPGDHFNDVAGQGAYVTHVLHDLMV